HVDVEANMRVGFVEKGAQAHVHHRSATTETGSPFDRDVPVERGHELGTEDVCDGHRVVDGGTAVLVEACVEADIEVQHCRDDLAHRPGAAQPCGVLGRQYGLVRHVEPDHRQVEPALEDPEGGLGVGPDVELGGGGLVAL